MRKRENNQIGGDYTGKRSGNKAIVGNSYENKKKNRQKSLSIGKNWQKYIKKLENLCILAHFRENLSKRLSMRWMFRLSFVGNKQKY